jgi:excisionase family DNA binding protein
LVAQYRRGWAGDYWLTIAQAAEVLRVARQSVYRAIEDGRLPARRTAMGDLLIRRGDVVPSMPGDSATSRSGMPENEVPWRSARPLPASATRPRPVQRLEDRPQRGLRAGGRAE